MGLFSGMNEAKPSRSTGQYFLPGKYKVEIQSVKWIDGQRGKHFTVVETKVMQSNNPDISAGSTRSWVVDMANVMALPNLKTFLAVVSGIDPQADDVDYKIAAAWREADAKKVHRDIEQIMEDLVIKANVLKGEMLSLECVGITTREGKPFTRYNWSAA